MSVHRLCNNLINIQESDLFFQEFLYCQLIGCIEDCWHTATFSGCLDSHWKATECLHIRNLKSNLAKFRKIKTVSIQITSVRIVQCVLDRETHIRCSKLGHNGSILKFHHGMNNTLRLYHNLYMIQIHIKKPFRFHNFKAFVYQCCRIYSDLLSHYPVRMFESICHCHVLKIICGTSTKWSTGSCNQQLVDLFFLFSVNCLEDCTVLTVNRQDGNSVLFCHRHDQMTCCDKCFFVGKCDIFSCTDSFHGRADSNHSNNSRNKDIGLRHRCKLQKTVHPADNLCCCICDADLQIFSCFLIPDCCQKGMKLTDLLLQLFHTPTCTDCNYTKIIILPHYIQRLGSNGTGRS